MQEELKELKELKTDINEFEMKVQKLDSDFRVVIVKFESQIKNITSYLSEISGSLKELAKNSVSNKDLDNKILTHEKDCAKLMVTKVNDILDQRLGRFTFYMIGSIGMQLIITIIFLVLKIKGV